jgi:hypothetical protein
MAVAVPMAPAISAYSIAVTPSSAERNPNADFMNRLAIICLPFRVAIVTPKMAWQLPTIRKDDDLKFSENTHQSKAKAKNW